MTWNWQKEDWPEFTWDAAALEPLEAQFLVRSGEFIGAFRHVSPDDRDALRIELIGDEALKTSEIEGEILDRDSVQSSLRRQLGLAFDKRRVAPEEQGIAEMMVDLYRTFDDPLDQKTLFAWHKMVMAGHRRIETIGAYRKHDDAMQIVSGAIGHERVHFEAPPSARIKSRDERLHQMVQRHCAGRQESACPPLTRAGIAHLYFESIHPFEDGNGRIGRALSEKSFAQNLGQPTLIALAWTIMRRRKDYYAMLERSNKDLAITLWLILVRARPSSMHSTPRLSGSNSTSPRPASTTGCAASSTSGRRRRLPGCSGRASTASKGA